jgi:hypothetical protein
MASSLEGVNNLIRREIAKGFKNQLVKGVVRRELVSGVDSNGDPITTGFTDFPFEGIRDNFNRRFAVQAGIPVTDVRILIISGLIDIVPAVDDKVRIRDSTGQPKWHQVRSVLAVDPANAHIELQCFEIEDPS